MFDAPTTEPFDGATHWNNETGEHVRAVRWVKDGDHPLVERYPIERREFKGLIVVSDKEKHALRFGEWVLQDDQGRIWVEAAQTLPAKYVEVL